MLVTYTDVEEIEPNYFITEASTIGIHPGVKWPDEIKTIMGNGNHFLYHCHDSETEYGGDLISVTYKQRGSNLFLEVLND